MVSQVLEWGVMPGHAAGTTEFAHMLWQYMCLWLLLRLQHLASVGIIRQKTVFCCLNSV